MEYRAGWRFQKGNIPSPNARPGGPNGTSFKKGNRPQNWKPVGTEIIDSYGYLKVKLAEPNVWQFKHVLIWEAAHGPVKPGAIVRFIDNNPLNCVLENLESVTKAENLRMNKYGYSALPAELKPVMKSVVSLEVKAFELTKRVGS